MGVGAARLKSFKIFTKTDIWILQNCLIDFTSHILNIAVFLLASSYLHEGCTVLPTKSGRPLSVADKSRETVAPGEGAGAGAVLRHQDTGAHGLGGEVVVLARLTGVVGLQP